jgi:hypothetical protein
MKNVAQCPLYGDMVKSHHSIIFNIWINNSDGCLQQRRLNATKNISAQSDIRNHPTPPNEPLMPHC